MPDRSSLRIPRRGFISLVAAIGGTTTLSGCATRQDDSPQQVGATDVVVLNDASSRKTATVTITDVEAETTHTERTIVTAPSERLDVNRGKLPLNTAYRIAVSVENGPSETFEWDDPVVDRAPLWILIDDGRNIRFLLQAG
jgi:hypothetical protein